MGVSLGMAARVLPLATGCVLLVIGVGLILGNLKSISEGRTYLWASRCTIRTYQSRFTVPDINDTDAYASGIGRCDASWEVFVPEDRPTSGNAIGRVVATTYEKSLPCSDPGVFTIGSQHLCWQTRGMEKSNLAVYVWATQSQILIDREWQRARRQLVAGGCCGLVGLVGIIPAAFLFRRMAARQSRLDAVEMNVPATTSATRAGPPNSDGHLPEDNAAVYM